MSFLRPYRSLYLGLVIFGLASYAQAQTNRFYLRNGDRFSGIVISENTNQVVISNSLSRELVIPLAEISSREILPLDTNSAAGASPPMMVTTNLIGTNLLDTPRLVIAVQPVPPPAVTNTFWSRWKGEVAVGLDLERGATDHELYYGRGKVTYAQPYERDPKQFFRNIFNLDLEYGKTDGVISDNRIQGSSKTDFDLSRRYYVYNLGEAFHDEIRLIDLHYEEGPGLGYHWFTRTNFLVNLEAGANYQVEERSDFTRTESFYYRLGEDLTWKLNKLMTLTEKLEYFEQSGYWDQYRVRFESTLSYSLLFHMSLNVTVADSYDTRPAATVPNNDFQLRTSLGVKF